MNMGCNLYLVGEGSKIKWLPQNFTGLCIILETLWFGWVGLAWTWSYQNHFFLLKPLFGWIKRFDGESFPMSFFF